MKLFSSVFVFATILGLPMYAQSQPATATALKEYSNAQANFTFKYPERWTPMTPDEVKQKTQSMMQVMPGSVIFLVNDRDADRNLNLQIVPSPTQTATVEQLRDLEKGNDQRLPSQFPGFHKVSGRIVTVAGQPALEYVMDVKRIEKTLRQKQVFFIASGKAYIFSFTSPAESFGQANETCFNVVVASFSLNGRAGAGGGAGAAVAAGASGSPEDLIGAADRGDVARVQSLLTGGVPINATWGQDSVTALIAAAQKGHVEVLKVLIDAHANLNAKTRDGLTAVMQAAQAGYAPAVRVLAAAGADLNIARADGATALIGAAEHGHGAIVTELLNGHADVSKTTDAGVTAIAAASLYGFADIVRALIAAGADVNVRDRRFSATSLIMASQQGHVEVVRALIAGHADVNVRMPNGQSALDLALSQGRTQVVTLLRQAGAK